MKDELNKDFIFRMTHNELLGKAIKGEIDLLQFAKNELAARGYNENGKWIGLNKQKNICKPIRERAKIEGFKNPDDPKTWSVYRYLLPEMSVWAQASNAIEKDYIDARSNINEEIDK